MVWSVGSEDEALQSRQRHVFTRDREPYTMTARSRTVVMSGQALWDRIAIISKRTGAKSRRAAIAFVGQGAKEILGFERGAASDLGV